MCTKLQSVLIKKNTVLKKREINDNIIHASLLCVLSVYKFLSLLLQQESEKGIQKKQTKFEMQRALEQDPSVYQYDEIYDKMEQKKIETKAIQKDQGKKVQG